MGGDFGRKGIHEGRWVDVKVGTVQDRVAPVAISKGS